MDHQISHDSGVPLRGKHHTSFCNVIATGWFCIITLIYCFYMPTLAYASVPLEIFASAMVKCIIIHAMLPDALRF